MGKCCTISKAIKAGNLLEQTTSIFASASNDVLHSASMDNPENRPPLKPLLSGELELARLTMFGSALFIGGIVAFGLCIGIDAGPTDDTESTRSLFQSSKKAFFVIWGVCFLLTFGVFSLILNRLRPQQGINLKAGKPTSGR